MPHVVLTAQVEASSAWEKAYRSHGDLFRQLWNGPVPTTHFAATDQNEIVMHMEVDDLDEYFEILERSEIADAMANDGVKRETVKVYVLDKTASF